MRRVQPQNSGPLAIGAIFFAVFGFGAALLTANSNPISWEKSLYTAFWLLIGSSILSAACAIGSLATKVTGYGILLAIVSSLYAGALIVFALSLGFR